MTYDGRENSAHSGEPIELYRFTVGADEWLYTSADVPFTLLGKTYAPVFIDRGNLSVTDETPRESLDVTVARDNPTAALFNAQAPDGTMYLTILREHRGETDFIQLGRWRVLAVTWANSQALQKCEPLFTSLSRPILRLRFAIACRHALFDVDCGVLKAAFATLGILSGVSGNTMSALAFGALASGYLKGGELDAGSGKRRRIIDHVGDTITLTSNIPGIANGAVVTAFPGCNKLIAGDCLNKFNNTPNHGGFPNIPIENLFETGIA